MRRARTTISSSDTFAAVIYDAKRKQVYLSAGDHVDVFSLASNQFVAPLHPAPNGTKKQFAGLALTPDGASCLLRTYWTAPWPSSILIPLQRPSPSMLWPRLRESTTARLGHCMWLQRPPTWPSWLRVACLLPAARNMEACMQLICRRIQQGRGRKSQ